MKYDKALDLLRQSGYLVQEHEGYALAHKEHSTGGVFARLVNKNGQAILSDVEGCASKLNWFLTIILFPLGLLVMGYWLLKKESRKKEVQFIVS